MLGEGEVEDVLVEADLLVDELVEFVSFTDIELEINEAVSLRLAAVLIVSSDALAGAGDIKELFSMIGFPCDGWLIPDAVMEPEVDGPSDITVEFRVLFVVSLSLLETAL